MFRKFPDNAPKGGQSAYDCTRRASRLSILLGYLSTGAFGCGWIQHAIAVANCQYHFDSIKTQLKAGVSRGILLRRNTLRR
jgi:hypothetical protein